ncbi:MAG TPA: exo-alpha-sialidase [Candidatus Brocadiia bacterium]|nr:exo-alpha-sialidase [Candidatus Brocadiia bacterium]
MLPNLICASLLCLGADAPKPLDVPARYRRAVQIHRVFGPEHPGPYKHPASITQLRNGDLYIAYYGGSGEYEDDSAVFGSRLRVGETQWTPPEVIADSPFHGDGNAVVWQAPDGVVWLFFVSRFGDTWCTSRVKMKISLDGAQTWSDSTMLTFEEGTMVRGQPIVLNDGDYLLPLYSEKGGDRECTASTTCSFFMRFNPATRKWSETNRIHSKEGNLQAQVVQLTDDYLVTYIRRGGDFLPTTEGYTLRAESRDGGRTWTDAVRTKIPNPNSAVDFIKLKNGHLLLVYNDNMCERTPLTIAISTDGDKTYPHKRNIAGGDNSFAYPYAIQTADEKIHIIYTTNDRTTIMHAVFDETAILEWPEPE